MKNKKISSWVKVLAISIPALLIVAFALFSEDITGIQGLMKKNITDYSNLQKPITTQVLTNQLGNVEEPQFSIANVVKQLDIVPSPFKGYFIKIDLNNFQNRASSILSKLTIDFFGNENCVSAKECFDFLVIWIDGKYYYADIYDSYFVFDNIDLEVLPRTNVSIWLGGGVKDFGTIFRKTSFSFRVFSGGVLFHDMNRKNVLKVKDNEYFSEFSVFN